MTQIKYLEGHGISQEYKEKFELIETGEYVSIPVKDIEGNLLFIKTRNLNPNEPKFRNASGSKNTLFNASTLKNKSYVIICGGEIDCIRLSQESFSAVTATTGEGAFEKEWIPLFAGKQVFLLMDNDRAGIEATGRLFEIFPDAKSIQWPDEIKDSCEYFIKYNHADFLAIAKQALTYSQWQEKYPEYKSKSHTYNNSDSLTLPLGIIKASELIDKVFPPNKWLVENLVPSNGITCISGKPKAGKSIFTLYLAISIATGKSLLNKYDLETCPVLFISKEDPQRLLKERINALSLTKDLPLYFCTDTKLFLDSEEYIEELQRIIQEKNIKVLIFDSFRRIFKGEENSSQVISEVHNQFKTLLKNEELSIIFIHHHGKEGFFKRDYGDKLRGSSDILAMLDSLLIIDRTDSETIKLTQGALRSDKPIDPIVVKFPDFNSDNPTFEYLGVVQEETEKIEQAKEDILETIEEGSKNQKEIIEILSLKKYKPTTIKNALKELTENKKLDFIKEGNKKYYLLPPDNEEVSS